MYQIVYLSSARPGWSDLELQQLSAVSSQNNQDAGVTGLLLYDGARFLQALEGPEIAVTATMARIRKDERHSEIRFFNSGIIMGRQFGNWSMQLKRAPEGCCSAAFLEAVKDNLGTVEDPHLRAAFIGFAAIGVRRPKGYACQAG